MPQLEIDLYPEDEIWEGEPDECPHCGEDEFVFDSFDGWICVWCGEILG